MDEKFDSAATALELSTLMLDEPWDWDRVLSDPGARLAAALVRPLTARRWFGGKAAGARGLAVVDSAPVGENARLMIAEIELTDGTRQLYQVPLAVGPDYQVRALLVDHPEAAWARVVLPGGEVHIIYDPLADAGFCSELLKLFDAQAMLPAAHGRVVARQTGSYRELRGLPDQVQPARLLSAEQSNTSVAFGSRLIFKLFRRVERGLNPDLEMSARLTEQGFANAAPLAGSLEYQPAEGEAWSLGVLQQFVPNHGDAWQDTTARLARFLQQELSQQDDAADIWLVATRAESADAKDMVPPRVQAKLGSFLNAAELLGRRTAEMHLALAGDHSDAAFAPEPLTGVDWRDVCARARDMASDTFALLAKQAATQTPDVASSAATLSRAADEQLLAAAQTPVEVDKVRCHGDFHLGQVLVTDGDFVIIDFEGEPARPLALRRQKQIALRDVAGMIRSFHYAAGSVAESLRRASGVDASRVERMAAAWYEWTSAAFLAAYRTVAHNATFLPVSETEFHRLLKLCLIEKAIYELQYELNNRPDWVYLPLGALVELLGERPSG